MKDLLWVIRFASIVAVGTGVAVLGLGVCVGAAVLVLEWVFSVQIW